MTTRTPTQDDLNAAARAFNMVALDTWALADLTNECKDSPEFASQVIAGAARQILAVKLRNFAPNPGMTVRR